MKKGTTRWLFVLLTAISCTRCGAPNSVGVKNATLPLAADTGFLTKKEIFPFLVAANLLDATQIRLGEQNTNEGDTIAKYYPSNTAGNHIVLVMFPGNESRSVNYELLELDAKNELLRHRELNINRMWCVDDCLKSFSKHGRYFMIDGCGHGPGYSSVYKVAFEGLEENACCNGNIVESVYSLFSSNQTVTSEMLVTDSTIKMHYVFEDGVYVEEKDEYEMNKPIERDVTYVRRNNEWAATDSTFLKKMDLTD